MGVIRILACAALLCVPCLAEVTIDGEWSAIEPTPQPTALIASPFGLELETTPEQIVTWTWSQGLSVWKNRENRLEVAADDGVYQIGWTIRTVNFEAGRVDTEVGNLIFQVGASGQNPPDPPTPPDVPPDARKAIDALAVSAVAETSGDVATASAIGRFYKSWAETADATQSKEQLRESLRKGTGDVLLNREGDADWESAWREPFSKILADVAVQTYISLVAYAGDALIAESASLIRIVAAQTQPRAPPEPTRSVVMYTAEGCELCEVWWQSERPKFERAKFEVTKEPIRDGETAPTFTFTHGGKAYKHVGYLSPKVFNRLISRE